MINQNYLRSFKLLKDSHPLSDTYPFNLPVVHALSKCKEIKFHKNVTFIIGDNGSGKSTLLEAFATQYGFNPEGGSKNFNFSTHDTHSTLSDAMVIVRGVKKPKDGYFFRAETFYNLASNIDRLQSEEPGILNAYGGKSLHMQSHGESFWSLFINRFFGEGIYILDEPEAAFSAQRQFAFLVRLHQLVEENSQFVIATHSPILLAYPNSKIIQIKDGCIKIVNYKDTEQYQLYKYFLNNPEEMLKELGVGL